MSTPHHSSKDGRKRVIVGSRGSGLAVRQTEEVIERLKAVGNEQWEFQAVTISTVGDSASEAPLTTLGRGIFVKEIERALLDGELDMAVHSLKDLPTQLPPGLTLGAICERADPRDVLVDRWGLPLEKLPAGARIGTSSPRRLAQLRAAREDLEVLPIRGNVDTRVRKAMGPDYDGAVLAAAGLARTGQEDSVSQYLSPEEFVPAPGQGALAVEIRDGDHRIVELLRSIDHGPTRRAITAERAFLELLGGGCQLPVGAYARDDGDTMVLTVFLASADSNQVFRTKVRSRAANPHETAMDAHQRVIERGAGDLLKAVDS